MSIKVGVEGTDYLNGGYVAASSVNLVPVNTYLTRWDAVITEVGGYMETLDDVCFSPSQNVVFTFYGGTQSFSPPPRLVLTTLRQTGMSALVPGGVSLNLGIGNPTGLCRWFFLESTQPATAGQVQIWAVLSPQAGAPDTPPSAPQVYFPPLSMSSWTVAYAGSIGGKIIDTIALQRSTDGGATWLTVDSHTDSTNGENGGTLHTFTDSVPTGPLAYRVEQSNGYGTTDGPTLTVNAPLAPSAPTLAALTMTSWLVSWVGTATAYQYEVQRSIDGESTWSTIATQTGTSYTDTTVPAGPLAYRIVAQNSVGDTTGAPTAAAAPTAGGLTSVTLTEILT